MRVARIRGIDVRIHWSFWLLIIFYLVSVSKTEGLAGGMMAVAFVASIFFCVLLHEFGHAFAAQWYGIPTVDITLLPIGGVARLQRMPDKPSQELVVALAGPAVNVVIAGLLLLPLTFGILASAAAPAFSLGTNFVAQLLAVNIVLVLFNMLPVFPMDGGRVLRSLLAIRLGHLRATQIAARIGRWLALALGIWAAVNANFLLVLLAVFIFVAGTMELMQVKMRSMQSQMEIRYGQAPPWGSAATGPFPTSKQWNDPGPLDQSEDIIDAVEVRHLR